MTKYQVCKFDEQSFLKIPEIGDSFVTSLTVLVEEHELRLTTDYRMSKGAEPQTVLIFSGVEAHHFDHVIDPSIIFGIEDSDFDAIYDIWEYVFINGKNHGWPIEHKGKDDLISKLHENQIKCYKVYGSCGLDGFVLAKTICYEFVKK